MYTQNDNTQIHYKYSNYTDRPGRRHSILKTFKLRQARPKAFKTETGLAEGIQDWRQA